MGPVHYGSGFPRESGVLSTTGAFVIRTGAIDTNGGCGIWDPTLNPPEGLRGTITRAGTDLSLTAPDLGTLPLLTIPSTASTLIGAFGGANGNDGSLVGQYDDPEQHDAAGADPAELRWGDGAAGRHVRGSNQHIRGSGHRLPGGAPPGSTTSAPAPIWRR